MKGIVGVCGSPRVPVERTIWEGRIVTFEPPLLITAVHRWAASSNAGPGSKNDEVQTTRSWVSA